MGIRNIGVTRAMTATVRYGLIGVIILFWRPDFLHRRLQSLDWFKNVRA